MSVCPPISITRRLIAGVLALAHLLTLPNVSQVGAQVAAGFHGEHELQVVTDDGCMEIVLHHHHLEDSGAHDHQALPRGAAMAVDDDDHHDHVFHFKTPDPTRKTASILVRALLMNVAMTVLPIELEMPGLPVVQRGPLLRARPPPLASMGMLCLRTTVLTV